MRIFWGSTANVIFFLTLTVVVSIVIDKLQNAAFACDEDMGRYLVLQGAYCAVVSFRHFVVVLWLCGTSVKP